MAGISALRMQSGEQERVNKIPYRGIMLHVKVKYQIISGKNHQLMSTNHIYIYISIYMHLCLNLKEYFILRPNANAAKIIFTNKRRVRFEQKTTIYVLVNQFERVKFCRLKFLDIITVNSTQWNEKTIQI